MAAKRKLTRNTDFLKIPKDISDYIVKQYESTLAKSEDGEFYLSELPDFLRRIKIPHCFTKDVENCVEYFYDQVYSKVSEIDITNAKQQITLRLVKSYTISENINEIDEIIDIVDVDKLITNCGKFVKFKQNYQNIYDSWALFVRESDEDDGAKSVFTEDDIIDFKLTLPHLQNIKKKLGLDDSLSDSLLIDMLGSCSTIGPNDELANYDWDKLKDGKYVSIRDFAEILGQLGEYD